MTETKKNQSQTEPAQNRLRGFAWHLLAYFAAMVVLVPVNLFVYSETLWFVFPLVGWGSMLAIHVAFVLGLFGGSTSQG